MPANRPSLAELWDDLTKNDKAFLLYFARFYINKNIHEGLLPFISVGKFYDTLRSRHLYVTPVQHKTDGRVREILSSALKKRKANAKAAKAKETTKAAR